LAGDDRAPRVLFIVTAGSTARSFARGYVAYLAAAGYDVTLVADDVRTVSRELRSLGVKTESLAMKRDPSPAADLASLARMIRLVNRVQPDALLYATPKASMLASLAGLFLNVPVRVYQLWGLRLETVTGVKREMFRQLERLIFRCSTTIVANSGSLATRASMLGISTRDRIEVPGAGSSHGVDLSKFSVDAPSSDVDMTTRTFLDSHPGVTVGFIGRIHPDKGLDALLEALDGQDGFRILIVGRDEGSALPSPSGVPVHFVGEVSDVRPYLKTFDLLVLMSLREGFPNVVLEAAAMHVPAIVSDATGCIDSVVHAQTGVVVPVGDISRLREALHDLAGDAEKRAYMGAMARRRVEELFSQEVVWGRNESLLRELLGKTKRT